MKRLGVIAGLYSEVRCLHPDRDPDFIMARASGANAERAYQLSESLVQDGAKALVSFGMAGALDPTLRPGDVIIPDQVIRQDGSQYAADKDWLGRLSQAVQGDFKVDHGAMLGVNRAVTSPGHKRELYETTGAVAVDMESFAVAEVARKAGVPFIVVRAVADPLSRAIPVSAMAGLGVDGRTHALPVLAQLLRRPREFPWVFRLALDSRKALKSLRRVAFLGGPFFHLL